eukprot:TRINITY_DN5087_c0_g1_i1.p3 TRINITY_DN5087_c0_g1~~TRINITY_DN5087_c0_g1_i1.p3  ORF type:complete len:170 (-),score=18.47 TRINITY_DN5087_c0_g1_i1:111-620(-)
MVVDWYVISPRTDGDKAMYTVCSTLLHSLENMFKAIRRNLCFFASRTLLLASNYLGKRVSKYFTKEEMEDLKERAENLSSTMAAAYRKYSPLSKEERDSLMSAYIPRQRPGDEGKNIVDPSKVEFRDTKMDMKRFRQGTVPNLFPERAVHKGAPKTRVHRAPILSLIHI